MSLSLDENRLVIKMVARVLQAIKNPAYSPKKHMLELSFTALTDKE